VRCISEDWTWLCQGEAVTKGKCYVDGDTGHEDVFGRVYWDGAEGSVHLYPPYIWGVLRGYGIHAGRFRLAFSGSGSGWDTSSTWVWAQVRRNTVSACI